MIGRARSYIIYSYFKYILILLFIFLGLIWLSQIIRILELQYSISNQIFEIAGTTLLALPSFINPLVPFLVLIGGFFVNTRISTSNEIIILKQYLSLKGIKFLFQFLIIFILIIYTANNEILSKKFYEKYKVKELQIRNNLKLGSPTQNEFHIDDILSIFFKTKKEDVFYDVEAVIYNQNQFITSESVNIELSKSNFNLVFFKGERMILNNEEKSNTKFDKFTYILENKKYETLYMDKDHYNTFELITHPDIGFSNHGHNRVFQYFFLFLVCLISLRIIFFLKNKKNNVLHFSFIFFLIFIIQIINSLFVYLLNNSTILSIVNYYIINLFLLIFAYFISRKVLK